MDPEERWDSLVLQADVCLRSGNADRLHEIAQDLIECRPDDEFGYRMAGESSLRRGKVNRAITLMQKAVAADPDNDFAIYRLSTFHRRGGNTKLAEKLLHRAIELVPNYVPYWVELAEISLAEDDHAGAQRYARRAVAVDADCVEARQLLSRSLADSGSGHYPMRLEILDHALQSDPENADVWDDRAELLLKMGRVDEAEDAARQALFLEPDNPFYCATLHAALKRRSWIYRVLRWPGDALAKCFNWIEQTKWSFWLVLCLLGVGLRLLFLLIALGALWLTCVFPMLKLYEWVMMANILVRARENPMRRSRARWFSGMSVALRVLVFVAVTAGFWYLLYRMFDTDTGRSVLAIVIAVAVGLTTLASILGLVLMARDRRRARRRRARVEGVLQSS